LKHFCLYNSLTKPQETSTYFTAIQGEDATANNSSISDNIPKHPKKAALQRHMSNTEQPISRAAESRQSLSDVDPNQTAIPAIQIQKALDVIIDEHEKHLTRAEFHYNGADMQSSKNSSENIATESDSNPREKQSPQRISLFKAAVDSLKSERDTPSVRRRLPQIPGVRSVTGSRGASPMPSMLSTPQLAPFDRDSAYESLSETSESEIEYDLPSTNDNGELGQVNHQILAIVGLVYCPTFPGMKAEFSKLWEEAKSRVWSFSLSLCQAEHLSTPALFYSNLCHISLHITLITDV
jgi:hypothetical protein